MLVGWLVGCALVPSVEGDVAGECTDAVDNDQDGMADCDDPGCAMISLCQQTQGTSPTFVGGGSGGGPGGGGTLDTDAADSGTPGTDTGNDGATGAHYLGGWHIADCKEDIESTGYEVGEIAPNFVATDQFGDKIELHAFCDRTVVLVASAEWCGPCQMEAEALGASFDAFEQDGLMIITLLGQDVDYGATDSEDLDEWASQFDLTHPVVMDDTDWSIAEPYLGRTVDAIPYLVVIGPGAEVLRTDLVGTGALSEDMIIDYLPGNYGSR